MRESKILYLSGEKVNRKKTFSGLAVLIAALAISYKYNLFAMIELTPDQKALLTTLPIQDALRKKCPHLKQKFVDFMYKAASTPIAHTQGTNTIIATNADHTLTAASTPYNANAPRIESYQARVLDNTGKLLHILPFYNDRFSGGLSPIGNITFISNDEIVLGGHVDQDLRWNLQILAEIKNFLRMPTIDQCELLQALDILYSRMNLGKPDQPIQLTRTQWITFSTFPLTLKTLFLGRFIQAH